MESILYFSFKKILEKICWCVMKTCRYMGRVCVFWSLFFYLLFIFVSSSLIKKNYVFNFILQLKFILFLI